MSEARRKALEAALALKHATPPQLDAYKKSVEELIKEAKADEQREKEDKRNGRKSS